MKISAQALHVLRQRSFWKHLWSRRSQGTPLVLLMGILSWGFQASTPALLTDLAGSWEACAAPGEGDAGCEWRQVTVPAHFVARSDESFGHHIHYRRSFTTPPECETHTCKLIFAEVGDSADVQVNGVLLRESVPVDEQHVYRKNFPLGIDLPPEILRKGEAGNQAVVRVYSYRDQQAGLRAGPIGVTTSKAGNAFLQWRTFRNVYVPLTCSIVAAVVVLLCGFLSREGVSPGLWHSFYAYATASAIFMFSFSEIPRALWPMAWVIPAHFFLRFYTDFSLVRLILASADYDGGRLWRLAQGAYRVFLGLFAALFVAGVGAHLAGREWVAASSTFTLVLFAYPLSTVLPALLAARAVRSGRPWVGGAVGLFVVVVLHEWAIGSGFLQGEFLSKYHYLLATGGFLLLLVRRAARAQAEQAMAQAAERELVELARQVDHDIRSPLTALDMAARELSGAPEDIRVLIRMAIDRIRDIASSLRQRRSGGTTVVAEDEDAARPLLLIGVVEDVTSEKRAAGVHGAQTLEHRLSAASYGLFVRAQPGVLKRVLSNLLNNALEAAGDGGKVEVRVAEESGMAHIVITDDGPGIPAHVLQRWGERGVTVGKRAGSGFGVNHAVSSIEALGGSVRGRNLAGGGAEVTVRLPLCEAPRWFAQRVELERGQTVVIVDDDRSVHAAWRERLREVQVAIVHVSSAGQLQRWLDERPAGRISYLVDYELAGGGWNGLNIITQWPLQGEAFLVTSHFETTSVATACEEQQVAMMPKSLVCLVPLTGDAVPTAA